MTIILDIIWRFSNAMFQGLDLFLLSGVREAEVRTFTALNVVAETDPVSKTLFEKLQRINNA
jgi:hypothetical protein